MDRTPEMIEEMTRLGAELEAAERVALPNAWGTQAEWERLGYKERRAAEARLEKAQAAWRDYCARDPLSIDRPK